VHAFEPQADLAQRLARVVPANVVVHHAAVGERSGTAALAVGHDPGSAALAHLVPPDRAGEPGAAVAQVPLVALDDLDLADVAFVKVDVECHELAVLRGAERLLLRDRPVLLVEIEQRHLEWPMATIFEWLEERGWAGSFLRDGHWVELAGFDVERDQTQWTAQLPHPAYVNNFRFDPV
jgi:FkbM family methyltransferase